ncbi:hypothetical protein N0V90_010745 [Kalmusia sp. IMI 367209]|nr:hypothetical protein N0V90_010745 [Kalmusia sp. IMI 367209]
MVDLDFHIDTPRLVISHLDSTQDSHCDLLVTLYNTAEDNKSKNGAAAPIADREAARKNIESSDRDWSSGYGRYLVSLKTPTLSAEEENLPFSQRIKSYVKIGAVSMKFRRFEGAPLAPDVGYRLMSAFQGKGYATEAAGAIVRWFEEEKGQREFFGFTDPDNERSKAVLRRIGFEERGVRDIKGIRADGVVLTGSVWSKGLTKSLEEYGLSSNANV